jgi:hypothetical protein
MRWHMNIKDLLNVNEVIQIPFNERLDYISDLVDSEHPKGWQWMSKQLHKEYRYTIYETNYPDIWIIRRDLEESEMFILKGTYEKAHEFLGREWIPSHFFQSSDSMLFFDKKTGRSFIGSKFLERNVTDWVYCNDRNKILIHPTRAGVLEPMYDNTGLYIGYYDEGINKMIYYKER